MMKYAILDENGIPLVLAEETSLPSGAVLLDGSAHLETLSRQMVSGGVWVDRPVTILTATSGPSAVVTLVASSEAASVRILDMDAGEVLLETTAGPGADWEFVDPGSYQIEIEPALPWLPATLQLEVPE